MEPFKRAQATFRMGVKVARICIKSADAFQLNLEKASIHRPLPQAQTSTNSSRSGFFILRGGLKVRSHARVWLR
jgi:hypothetical protein